MKLLLTSAGLANESIADALAELAGKPIDKTKIGFIPMAANVEAEGKQKILQETGDLKSQGFNSVDIIDPSADNLDWRPRLESADVIFVGGGNTFHLLDQMRKTGLGEWLKENLERKVYAGVSAGTIVACKTIGVASIEPADPNLPGLTDLSGLGLVDFEVEPHCDNERFGIIRSYAKGKNHPVYAIDDATALKVVDNNVQAVGRGRWEKYE